jgi:glycosyltransferase involved in cell wall biosynthesis
VRVLILTQHFAPEVTAGRFRLESFARGLSARGHEVQVICPVPSHPHGVVEPAYRGRLLRRQRKANLSVVYLPVFTRHTKTATTRLAYYGSYASAAIAVGSVLRRPDVVLASSPPLSVGAAGALVARRHHCRFVFDVRDLWPESAVVLGELGEGRVLRAAEWLERDLYRRADLVLTANHAFAGHISSRGADSAKVATIFNGTTREWLDAGKRAVERGEVGLPIDRFVWVYAGNLGLAHAVDTAIDAAGLLGPEFRLLIVGEGPRRDALRAQAEKLPPGSVEFRGLVEPAEAARIIRAADASLVAERQAKTVSAKLYDYCAVGRPVVAVAQGELERVIEEEGVALAVPLEDPAGLAAAVRRIRDDPRLAEQLTARARAFASAHLRERQAERMAELLEALV